MAQKKQGGYIDTQLVKPRSENKMCLSKGWVRGDHCLFRNTQVGFGFVAS